MFLQLKLKNLSPSNSKENENFTVRAPNSQSFDIELVKIYLIGSNVTVFRIAKHAKSIHPNTVKYVYENVSHLQPVSAKTVLSLAKEPYGYMQGLYIESSYM